MASFCRLAFGNRFDGVFRSNDPAVYTHIALGMIITSNVTSSVNLNENAQEPPIPQTYGTGEVVGDFTIAYGLPGKPGYQYERPFDYFHFQFTAASSNTFENVMSRGLLFGTNYSIGDNYRGIWGLYGLYDYIAPQIFRISNTAAALGTTGQWWLTRTVALRLILSDRVYLDMTAREYYVSDIASQEKGGDEKLFRGDASLTVRIHNLHGITLKYAASRRDATYAGLTDTHQRVAALSIGYTYLGQTRSGAVDWRPKPAGEP